MYFFFFFLTWYGYKPGGVTHEYLRSMKNPDTKPWKHIFPEGRTSCAVQLRNSGPEQEGQKQPRSYNLSSARLEWHQISRCDWGREFWPGSKGAHQEGWITDGRCHQKDERSVPGQTESAFQEGGEKTWLPVESFLCGLAFFKQNIGMMSDPAVMCKWRCCFLRGQPVIESGCKIWRHELFKHHCVDSLGGENTESLSYPAILWGAALVLFLLMS